MGKAELLIISFYPSAPLPVLPMLANATTLIYQVVKENSSSDQLLFPDIWHKIQQLIILASLSKHTQHMSIFLHLHCQ